MNPQRITIPEEGWIYRGDLWAIQFNFSRDVSDLDFLLQLKASRFGALVVEADIDVSNAGGTTPFFIVCTVPGVDTATIEQDRLEADLQVAVDQTWLRFSLPVKGQISEVVSA